MLRIRSYRPMRVVLFVAFAFAFCAASWAADNEKVIYNFTGGNDGGDAAAQLAFDSAGNMYGTTVVGGLYGCGTVFELSPSGDQWNETVLFNFDCLATGKNPYGGV